MTDTTAETESSIVDNDDGTLTLMFCWPDQPWTVNQQARGTSKAAAYKYAALTKQWRTTFARLAEGCPALEWCDVEVRHEKRTNTLPDTGSCYMTAKAALDGVVDAGVLCNDTVAFVRTITMHPARWTGRDALIVELRGPAA